MIGERRRAQEGDDEGKGGPEEEAMVVVVVAWSQKNHPCCRFRQDKKYIKDK